MENKDSVAEATLMFTRDKEDKNWISRLPSGKIVILHRADPTKPEPNVPYRCKIQEKEKEVDGKKIGYALAWIIGIDCYPRVIIKQDRTCVLIKDPKSKPEHYSSVYDAYESLEDRETLFMIYRRENREEQKVIKKKVSVDLKISTPGEPSLRKSVKIERPADMSCEAILNEILKRLE